MVQSAINKFRHLKLVQFQLTIAPTNQRYSKHELGIQITKKPYSEIAIHGIQCTEIV